MTVLSRLTMAFTLLVALTAGSGAVATAQPPSAPASVAAADSARCVKAKRVLAKAVRLGTAADVRRAKKAAAKYCRTPNADWQANFARITDTFLREHAGRTLFIDMQGDPLASGFEYTLYPDGTMTAHFHRGRGLTGDLEGWDVSCPGPTAASNKCVLGIFIGEEKSVSYPITAQSLWFEGTATYPRSTSVAATSSSVTASNTAALSATNNWGPFTNRLSAAGDVLTYEEDGGLGKYRFTITAR